MIITIHDNHSTVSIDTMGAQLISFQDAAGKEYIWQRDPAFWPRCSPLLFPAVGNSREGKTMFDGVWYDLPKHGFCKESDFEVAAQSESEAVFRLASNEMTRKHYPYDFVLSLAYHLKDGVLSMTYQVTNPQDTPLPYCIGAHPGFVCPMEEGASFEDYELEFEEDESTSSIVYDLENMQFDVSRHLVSLEGTRVVPLRYGLFDQDAVYFNEIRSRKVSLIHRESRKGIQVAYPGFSSVAFWTPDHKQAPFLCIEPWNGSAIRSDEDDEFLHKHDVQILGAGESRSHLLEIRILN
ncbi:aldose 1-epimerase family protein [Clostridium sp. AN503]|uniref:aldose 1-epimerase family protein n=1 Tax=Clostridium sp. AN503 TaxID=3160598 RepID=UPI003459A4BD